jgi:hypothetical protein
MTVFKSFLEQPTEHENEPSGSVNEGNVGK